MCGDPLTEVDEPQEKCMILTNLTADLAIVRFATRHEFVDSYLTSR